MHLSTFLACSTVALLARADNVNHEAPPIDDQPLGAAYVATLPSDGKVHGSISARTAPDGGSLVFSVAITGLPAEGGPFLYHIHDQPVPASGNCTATLAHLDPYSRGEDPPCDASAPQTCQVGDLSGKHGKMTPTAEGAFSASYAERFVDANPGRGSFLGNRSIVVHLANKTRIACANFEPVKKAPQMPPYYSPGVSGKLPCPTGGNGTKPGPTATVWTSITPTPTPPTVTPPTTSETPVFTGGAEQRAVTLGAVLGLGLGVMALVL